MFENAVEGDGCLDSDERVGVFGEAGVDAFDCLADYLHVQLHRPVLSEDVHSPGPQEHDLIVELGDHVLCNQRGQYVLDLLAAGDGGSQLADQVHGQFFLHRVRVAFQLALNVVHVLEEKGSGFIGLGLPVQFASQLCVSDPHVGCYSL